MIRGIDTRVVTVAARLNLHGHAEARGIRRRLDGPPLGTVSICGFELDLTLAEAEVLHDAMGELVADLRKAEARGDIAREPKTTADKTNPYAHDIPGGGRG